MSTPTSSAVVSALVQLIGSHPRTPLSQVVPDLTVPLRDTVARNAVLGALIIVTGLGLLVVHLRRGVSLVSNDVETSSPARRVAQSYVLAVLFVAVVVAAIAAILFIYSIFEIASPSVFGSTSRTAAARTVIDAFYVLLASGAIVYSHVRLRLLPSWPNRRESAAGPAGSTL